MSDSRPEQTADDLAADLANRYYAKLQFFAARRLRDGAAGEEVAQEALRRALEALRGGRVANLDALPAFLFETARNICMHRQRASGREARAFERLRTVPVGNDRHPLETLISDEEAAVVRRALRTLSESDRDLLLWSYRDGLDAGRIGERLGISAVAVRVRRHRALNRLAAAVGVTPIARREQDLRDV